jgi:hypothetical protein
VTAEDHRPDMVRARPDHGDQEGSARPFRLCYHPVFAFNQLGDVERYVFDAATCTAPMAGARWSR